MEDILKHWETFARTIQPADGKMSTVALRDHAEAILKVIATDIASPQTELESITKSRGDAPKSYAETAAESHAEERLGSGFSISVRLPFPSIRIPLAVSEHGCDLSFAASLPTRWRY